MTGSWRLATAGAAATFLASLALIPTHDGTQWLWMGLGATILVVLFGHLLRRIATPRLLIPLGQVVGLLWVFLLLTVRSDMYLGFLPNRQAMEAFALRLAEGMEVVVRYSAPLPFDSNAVLMTALGIGLIALAVDALASTALLAPWAGLPLLLLYSIPATTVTDGLAALGFVPAAVGYVGLLMVESRGRVNRWGRIIGVSDRASAAPEGTSTSLFGKTGRRVGAATIATAVVVPAFVPTITPDLPSRSEGSGFGGGGETIRIDNPIVNLRRDLRRPENLELITYRTNASNPDYLRLAVLDEFDGEQWRPTSRDVPRDQQVTQGVPDPPGLADEVPRSQVNTQFSITNTLRSKRLPLPYPPTQVDVSGDWRYDTDTLDVVVGPDESADATAGLEYSATSLAIQLDAAELSEAPEPNPEVADQYTDLPDDVSSEVLELTDEIVEEADNSYAQAVELQSWFRSEFLYSTEPDPGHGGSHLVEFLEDRRGYCEQFAATMAIMARSLDIPARVAVGYMPGTNQGNNSWVVKVHDAHAWPELYFEGYGWVRFEPTPSQQTGSAPAWTETAPDPPSAPDMPEDATTPEETRPNQEQNQDEPDEPAGLDPGETDLASDDDEEEEEPLLLWPFALGGGILLVLATPAMVRPLIRRARLNERADSRKRAERAWREIAATTCDLGMPWDSSATPRAVSNRLAARVPQHHRAAMTTVVEAVERAWYAPSAGDQAGLSDAVRQLRRALMSTATRRRRVMAVLVPRSVLVAITRIGRLGTWLLDGAETLGTKASARLRRRAA